MGNFHVKYYFKYGPVVQEMLFNENLDTLRMVMTKTHKARPVLNSNRWQLFITAKWCLRNHRTTNTRNVSMGHGCPAIAKFA